MLFVPPRSNDQEKSGSFNYCEYTFGVFKFISKTGIWYQEGIEGLWSL